MHCNYHFFKQLVPHLVDELKDKKLLACFSQEKDELVLGFSGTSSDCYIKCLMSSTFGGLFFQNDFHRARQNSADIFDFLIGRVVRSVYVFENERAIGMDFEGDYALVFKLFGSRSNAIVFEHDKVRAIFNSRLKDDLNMRKSELHRKLGQSKADFLNAQQNPDLVFPTWGKLPKEFYERQKTNDLDKNWSICENINDKLADGQFFVIRFEGKLYLSLLELGETLQRFSDPRAANNFFFIEKQKCDQFDNERNTARKQFERKIKQTENYLSKTQKRFEELVQGPGNQQIGHMIMAYLHQIPEQATEISLPDFDDGKLLTIRLKSSLSAQKNAEIYYRKAKKEQVEQEIVQRNIEQKTKELEVLNEQLESLAALDTLRQLRQAMPIDKDKAKKSSQTETAELFKNFQLGDFRILVGKNAKNNDLLTLKYAQKNDTWLHAKDVSGSHVVVRQIPGKTLPKNVLESAAGLAAWFSKRRTDKLVPVAFTLKKYIRKRKGSPDGQVVVEKEEVILIEPLDPKSFE